MNETPRTDYPICYVPFADGFVYEDLNRMIDRLEYELYLVEGRPLDVDSMLTRLASVHGEPRGIEYAKTRK